MAGVRHRRLTRLEPAGPGLKQVPARVTHLDELDRQIVNCLQGGFPIREWPFVDAARALGIGENELIERIGKLFDAGVLTRFGPLFNADRLGGANVLAAMSLPEHDFDRVASFVSAQPEIAHNYRREHALNLWFVGAAETPEKVETTFQYIESVSGYPVYRFPKEREYFVELKLKV